MPLTNKRASPAADEEYPTPCKRRPIELQQEPKSSMELEIESGDFPSDIVIAILSRLPVKTLVRLKSVCTNWDAMIPRNPYLVSVHLKNFTKASLLCFYLERGSPFVERSVSLCPEDDQRPINVDESLPAERVICGTDNGLFLLSDHPQPGSPHRPAYHLCNPATRETRLLPDPPLAPLRLHSDYAGVGLDLVANDIKVVLIRNYVYKVDKYVFPSATFVYTLRTNCWMPLPGSYVNQDGEDLHSQTPSCHTYFKGSFYWLIRRDRNATNYVLAFDMGNNVFQRINCPFGTSWEFNLTVYRDSVALFKVVTTNSSVHVWLLSKSGGQSCWIKHSNLGPIPEGLFVRGCWKNDKLIAQTLRSKDQLVLIDIDTSECKVLIPNCMLPTHWHVYKESLVCIE